MCLEIGKFGLQSGGLAPSFRATLTATCAVPLSRVRPSCRRSVCGICCASAARSTWTSARASGDLKPSIATEPEAFTVPAGQFNASVGITHACAVLPHVPGGVDLVKGKLVARERRTTRVEIQQGRVRGDGAPGRTGACGFERAVKLATHHSAGRLQRERPMHALKRQRQIRIGRRLVVEITVDAEGFGRCAARRLRQPKLPRELGSRRGGITHFHVEFFRRERFDQFRCRHLQCAVRHAQGYVDGSRRGLRRAGTGSGVKSACLGGTSASTRSIEPSARRSTSISAVKRDRAEVSMVTDQCDQAAIERRTRR